MKTMPKNAASRFGVLNATLRLLYRSQPRAFVVGAVASLAALLIEFFTQPVDILTVKSGPVGGGKRA
jgi:hypothetical protein